MTGDLRESLAIAAELDPHETPTNLLHTLVKQAEAELRIVDGRLEKVRALVDNPDFTVGRLVKVDTIKEVLE